jgi:CRISPR-associated protein Cas1
MRTVYVSQPGCYVSLHQEMLVIKKGESVLGEIQLPLLEQLLIFGQSQVTTQAIRTCLWRSIPIAYLSRMGYCYGRSIPIERGYRQLSRYQQQLCFAQRLQVARRIVQAKLKNSRVILMRQQRRQASDAIVFAIQCLEHLIKKAGEAETIEKLMGMEGAGGCSVFFYF